MQFELKDGFCLSSIGEGDQPAYLQHFSDKTLTDALVLVPFPYTQQDADQWVELCFEAARESRESQFALRRADGFLIGGAGLILSKGSHRAELGYWICREYQRRGLIRASVRTLIGYGFSGLGLKRIEATAQISNHVSQHILEKEGFHREGLLEAYHQKNGILLDCYMYAILSGARTSVR